MAQVAHRCSLSAGDTIDGRYSVTKTLGEGSFGKVYSVNDNYGRQYALKLLKLWEVPPDIRDSLIARFDMEFETARIDSDYLVHSISHGFLGGNPYIVMEFCPGGDLLNLCAEGNVNSTKVAKQVLMGLKALHNKGKVHRDLKPENVLIKGNGDFALTDFGISGDRNKRMTEHNIIGKPKQIFGTYAYMPPEQLRPHMDATVLPTTDIFSFGVMMFQLLTGELPFGPLEGEKDLVSYLKHGRRGEWNQSLLASTKNGKEWFDLIDGCLIPDFHKRLQNTDAVMRLVPHGQRISVKDVEIDFQTKITNGVLLRIMQGEEHGKVYRLDDMLRGDCSILSMGRKDEGIYNDIAITEENSSYISRKHCTLELDYDIGSWVIRDGQWDKNSVEKWKRSTNGTYVNSKEVGKNGMTFSPGDIISIGDTKLRAEGY